jgi:hypothetical protein
MMSLRHRSIGLAIIVVGLAITPARAGIVWNSDYEGFRYSVEPNGGSYATVSPAEFDYYEAESPPSLVFYDAVEGGEGEFGDTASGNLTELGGVIQLNAMAKGPDGGINPENGTLVQGFAQIILNGLQSYHGVAVEQTVLSHVRRRFSVDTADTYVLRAYLDGDIDFNRFGEGDSTYHALYGLRAQVGVDKYIETNEGLELEDRIVSLDLDTGNRERMIQLELSPAEEKKPVVYELNVFLRLETDVINFDLFELLDFERLRGGLTGPLGLGNPTAPFELVATLVPGNHPPVLDPIGNKTAAEGELLEFTISASDPDGHNLSFTASPMPEGASLTDNGDGTAMFGWTPDFGTVGNFVVAFTVTDDGIPQESTSETITISVGDVNHPPILDPIGNKTAAEGELLEFTISASDPDGHNLSFTASPMPEGASLTDNGDGTAMFGWHIGPEASGNYIVDFTVTDDGIPKEDDSEAVTISVGDVNRPPELASIDWKTTTEGKELKFKVTATDPDWDTMVLNARNLPPRAAFIDNGDGTALFSWTPGHRDIGIYHVKFTATDNGTPALADSQVVSMTVKSASTPPDRPTLFSPADGAMDVSLTPTLMAGEFFDPDVGDIHGRTLWRIIRIIDENESVILRIMSDKHLTSLDVPQFVLEENATYFWEVWFIDNNLAVSKRSERHAFTTLITGRDAHPENGIPDDQEVDDTVDLNGDRSFDLYQPDMIKSIITAVGDGEAGIMRLANVAAIEAVEAIDPGSISDTINRPHDLPLGLIGFKLRVSDSAEPAKVMVFFSCTAADDAKWYNYDSVNGWRQCPEEVARFSDDGRSVLLTLTDGGKYDADGAVNGIIVDPSGVTAIAEDALSSTVGDEPPSALGVGGDDDDSEFCFIGIATSGSASAWTAITPMVVVLFALTLIVSPFAKKTKSKWGQQDHAYKGKGQYWTDLKS